eukprot:3910749-Pleurochrysis_carterae.AAC.2
MGGGGSRPRPADFGGKCWRIGGATVLRDLLREVGVRSSNSAGVGSQTWRPSTSAPSSTRSSKQTGASATRLLASS